MRITKTNWRQENWGFNWVKDRVEILRKENYKTVIGMTSKEISTSVGEAL